MSFEATSRSATKKKFAEKFAKELEAHLAYGDKLAKSLSNSKIDNSQTTPIEDQDIQQALHAYSYSAVKPSKDEDNPSFTARIRDYIQQHQSQKVNDFDVEPQEEYRDNYSDYNTPDRKETLGRNVQYNTNQHQDDSVQTIDEINAKNYNTLQERYEQLNRSSASSHQAYSSNEGNRLPLSLPKRIQQNPAGDNRRDTSPILNRSDNAIQGAEVKRSESAQLEPSSYLFPNAEKNVSFKKKIISDSMQRLKSSVYNSGAPTRENSMKSALFHEPDQTQGQSKMEHELALRQMLANTSLTYENGDTKSLDDSFHTRDLHDRSHSMSIKKMDSMLDKIQGSRDQPLSERGIIPRGNGRLEEEGSIIQLRELFRNSANDANKLSFKKNSHPNTGRSPRDSCTASQLFRPSESESYVMNVSRLGELDDPAEIQERIEELRRYSMELGVGWNQEQNAPEPVKEVRRNQSDIGESSSANEHENTRYMSSNTVEGMKSLRTPDFQSYASHMKDNHFFAVHNQQDNARNGAGGQKRNNSSEGNKKSIIKKFSQELEKGLASRLPVPQPRPVDPQESSEYPESQEMMGFLSFSKEHGRTDVSETFQSPDKFGYDASVSYSRELGDRSHFKKAMQEEEKERAQISIKMEKQLAEAVSKVNIKTFLALRSILKPHRAIVLCCEGLVKLMAGFDDIPASLEEQESVDWSQIKALFNSPVKIVNLVSLFKNLASTGKISAQKIEAVELVLSRIQVHLDTPQHEAFNQLHSFLVAGVQYYESCFQDTYYNIRRETFEEPERVAPVPMQYTAAPQHKPKIPTANTTYKPVATNNGSRKSPIQSRYSQGKYSPQKVETNKVQEQRQSKSVGRARPPSDKKIDRENQGNTSNITRSRQNLRKEEPVRSASQTKSASRTPTKKNVSAKIDSKRVVLGQKPLEDNYMKGKKEVYEEEISEDGVRFLVDVEQSEAGELKDTIEAKEKEAREYRNKVKKMLFEHDRFVKKFLKQQSDLEDEINREFATEDWRKTNQMKQDQFEFERDWRHERNMDYINEKKEVKDNQDRENKENVNEELLEGLQDHYYHQFTVQTKKENKKKELREKYKSLLADKISKKQKETMDSISEKEELAQRRRDHFRSRKIDIENEKNKWQSDYLMLSKLIGDAK